MNDKRKASMNRKAIHNVVLFGLLFIADVVWGVITLHQWIYLAATVALFQLVAYLHKIQ
jgi:hypothetical protein